jgi:predicted MFS family arabinose efflux permease
MGNSKYVIADFDTFMKVMNVILPICAMITAPIVGTLVEHGRRSAMMITSGIFAAGCMLSLIFNFFTIFIGRVIMGGCIGAYLTLVPLMV